MASPSRTGQRALRLALRVGEAAAALGISEDHFAAYVAPELKWIRIGRVKLVGYAELESWIQRSQALTLDEPLREVSGA